MTRVSENSSFHAINHSVNKTKASLEDLQIKGSNLKRVQKPSDDPVGNLDVLAIRSKNVDAEQYLRNNNYAKTQLSFTETALDELTEIISKAKEIAIGQASNLYSPEVRQSISKEVEQLREQALAIGNKRMGNKYIFSGHKTFTRPFDKDGSYKGDNGKTNLEINKDFTIPINITGNEVFYTNTKVLNEEAPGLQKMPTRSNTPQSIEEMDEHFELNRTLASSETDETSSPSDNLFQDLQTLVNALNTNNFEIVQTLLPKFDDSLNRVVLLRAQIGSLTNSISNQEQNIENIKLQNESNRSKIEDADIAELFTELEKQKNVLNASYKISSNLMNQSLLNFVK